MSSEVKDPPPQGSPSPSGFGDLPLSNPAELYRALVESSPDGIFIADLRGVILFASPAGIKMLEASDASQVVGSNALDWVEPEDRDRLVSHLDQAGQNVFEEDGLYRFHTAAGRRFIGEISAAALHDSSGALNGLMAILRDVTDRFMASEALALTESKLQRMVQASPMGMHFYRLEPGDRLVLEDANPAADRILGIEHAPLVGKTIEEAFPGLEVTEVASMYRKLAAEGGQWQTDQIVYEEGQIRGAFEVSAFQTTRGHMVASFTDVTRRKQAEAQVRENEAQLLKSEAELRSREETLRKIAIDLHESNYALRASIAHEQLLRTLDKVIIENNGLRATAEALMRPIIQYFRADAAEILAYRDDSRTFHQIAGVGFVSAAYQNGLPSDIGLFGLAMRTRKIVRAPDVNASGAKEINYRFYQDEGFLSGYSALLETPGHLHGALQLFYRHVTELPDDMIDFYEMIARQVAIALEKALLWENHQKALTELVDAYATTLEGWVYALDLRDKETEDHTRRVTEMTVAMAEAMRVDPDEMANYRRGALLHDIGKIGIPDHILHKPGPLTAEEWQIMRQHPQFAREMLEPIAYLRGAIAIPYCHHERWDGSGYPRGLKAEEIPLEARLFAVVDVWDALTSDRPYRPAWSREKARAFLMDNANKLFDPEAVAAFFEVINTFEE